jgi:hypothetical protein
MVAAGLDYYRWLYFDNPVGQLLVDIAIDTSAAPERIAAVYASLPNRFVVGGRDVLGIQSLDSLTDYDYRKRGLFVKLAESLYARSESMGTAFVYGFPNDNSAPLFWRYLRWRKMDPLPLLIRPLRLKQRYLARSRHRLQQMMRLVPDLPLPVPRLRRLPNGDAIEPLVGPFDAAFDQLWARFAKGIGIAVVRRQDYLNWRLKAAPHQTYRTLTYKRSGRLIGFVSYCTAARDGAVIGRIMELIEDPLFPDVGAALLGVALRDLAHAGCEAALAIVFPHSPTRAAFNRHVFLQPPQRLLSGHHFGARRITWAGSPDPENVNDWYISYCDLDTL